VRRSGKSSRLRDPTRVQTATALSLKPKTGSAVSLAGPLARQDVQVEEANRRSRCPTLDRRDSVLGCCVPAVSAKGPLRAGHAGGVQRITHVASYPRWMPTVLPPETMGNVTRTRTAGWERSHCSTPWLRAKGTSSSG